MGQYHDTLGVSPSASEDDIRKAWIKLCQELHPDQNPDNEEAEERLKEVNRAYTELKKGNSDPEPEPSGSQGGYDPMAEEMLRRAAQHFAGATQGRTTIRQTVGVPVDKMISGATFELLMAVPVQIRGGFQVYQEEKEVTIPADTPVGYKLDLGKTSGTTAQLHVVPEPTKEISVEGLDLIMNLDVPVFDAMLGTKTEFRAPDGKLIAFDIPSGAPNGASIRLSDLGLRDIHDRRGDLYLQIKLTMPELSEKEKTKLDQALKKINLR